MNTSFNLGQRQKALLKSLLLSHQGLTVDELAGKLSISRNAVTQHLTSLEGADLVQNTIQSSTGGRPSKLYTLTPAGKEIFPKHYSLFANQLIHLLNDKQGPGVLKEYMTELGAMLAGQYQSRISAEESLEIRIAELVDIMQELGYEAGHKTNAEGIPEIVANNCVFHKLAESCEAVCELDLTLIATALNGVSINHKECMVRGGSCCRFAITQENPGSG